MPAAFVLVWSGGFAFAKIGLQHSGPLTLLAVRYVLVALLLAPAVLLLRPRFPDRRRAWAHMVVLGFLVQVLYFGLSMVALDEMSAGAVAVIVSLQPILVAILAGPVLAERVSPVQWLGLLLALAGALLVILPRSAARTSPLGVAAAVGALLAIAVATVYERRLKTTGDFLATNAVQYGVGAVMLVPPALIFERLRLDVTPAFVIAIGYLALGNSLLSLTLLFAMIRAGEAARVSALFFLIPPVSALIALILLREQLPLVAWAGMAVAGTGVAIATLRPARAREPA
jgi:drug/metabolite transporter (DMT)-like permease